MPATSSECFLIDAVFGSDQSDAAALMSQDPDLTRTTMKILPVQTAEEIEIAEFELLKPRLANLWDSVFPGDEESYTSVIVPSLTLDPTEMAKIPGIAFYEERLLFLLMRLRNPRAHVVYVTSQPIHPMVIDYCLQLLMGTRCTRR